jgi:crotonobetainyl-CoA:carnitine CoA-transferase CaiB-like acyl-CoA transferase
MDAVLTALLNQGSAWVAGGVVPGRLGNRHPSIVPYETFEAADRPIAVAVGNDRLFARLCTALGLDELPGDPRFANNEARVANVDALGEQLRAVFAREPADHWVEVLKSAGVPAGRINGVDEAWQLAAALGMEPIAEPEGVPVAAPPLRLGGERPAVRRRPPRLDEHGEEIRAWLTG